MLIFPFYHGRADHDDDDKEKNHNGETLFARGMNKTFHNLSAFNVNI